MKRYRILNFDFDSRAELLKPVREEWAPEVKAQHVNNQKQIIEGLILEYGKLSFEMKLENFKALGMKPFSVMAYHNYFLEQTRMAFVMGGYYPALTGACALGERILNHMLLALRGYHKESPQYKKIARKKSFDSWVKMINILEDWCELLPEAVSKFRLLHEKRCFAIHFNKEVEINSRALALEAIILLQEIVMIQFSSFGNQPWVLAVPGETYIKKKWEDKPFVKNFILPSASLVGPNHRIEISSGVNMVVMDEYKYGDEDITDKEFCKLREESKNM